VRAIVGNSAFSFSLQLLRERYKRHASRPSGVFWIVFSRAQECVQYVPPHLDKDLCAGKWSAITTHEMKPYALTLVDDNEIPASATNTTDNKPGASSLIATERTNQ